MEASNRAGLLSSLIINAHELLMRFVSRARMKGQNVPGDGRFSGFSPPGATFSLIIHEVTYYPENAFFGPCAVYESFSGLSLYVYGHAKVFVMIISEQASVVCSKSAGLIHISTF